MQYINISCTSSINDNNKLSRIYPNPNNGNFTIQSKGNSLFKLYSINGNLVYETILDDEFKNLELNLNNGIYFGEFNDPASGLVDYA